MNFQRVIKEKPRGRCLEDAAVADFATFAGGK